MVNTPALVSTDLAPSGFPPERPYRSIGGEPMLGTVFDLASAGPDDAAAVPRSGTLDWELHIRAIWEQR